MASWAEHRFVLREPVPYPGWLEAGRLSDMHYGQGANSVVAYQGREVVTCDLCYALVTQENFHNHAYWHTEQNLA